MLAALAIALLFAAFTDLRRRQIDNWLNAAIALGAPVFWWSSGFTMLDVGFQIVLAILTFVVLLVLFATGQMGGGDVKLLTALALWIHPLMFVQLVVVMAIAGGMLTIGMWGWNKYRRAGRVKAVPYGIAISLAGLWVLADHYLPVAGHNAILG